VNGRYAMSTIGILLMATVTSGQSLGDAAAREKARREKAGESGRAARTVTDEDLKNGARDGAESAGTYSPAAGTGATGPDVTTQQGGARSRPESRQSAPAGTARNGEEYWRSRMQAARTRVAEAEKVVAELEKLYLVEGEMYVDVKTGRPVVSSLAELRAMTARAKAERDVARQAVRDLEDEARRAGALPGWLR
jgi:hypothetical protein